MASLAFDPFRTQTRLTRVNRLARWKRDGAQTAVHAAALLALVAILAVPAWQSRASVADAVAHVVERWPWQAWCIALLVLSARHATLLARVRRHAASDWLAALPVPASLRVRRLRDRALAEAAWQSVAGGVVLASAGAVAFAAWLAAVVLAMALGAMVSRRSRRGGTRAGFLGSPVADRGAGRVWRWQRIAGGVALRGRTLAFGLLAWLAVPMGSGVGLVLALALAGLVTALLSGAWRRSLAVLPQAQAWLAAQPYRPIDLVRAACGVPMTVLGIAAAAAGALLAILGSPVLGVLAAAAIAMLGILQFTVVAAHRHAPSRAPLALGVHALLLLAIAQALPLAALPVWSWQVVHHLRRALR